MTPTWVHGIVVIVKILLANVMNEGKEGELVYDVSIGSPSTSGFIKIVYDKPKILGTVTVSS